MNPGYFDIDASYQDFFYSCHFCNLPLFDGLSINDMFFTDNSPNSVFVYFPLSEITVQRGEAAPIRIFDANRIACYRCNQRIAIYSEEERH